MKRITFLILLPVLLACSLTQGAARLTAPTDAPIVPTRTAQIPRVIEAEAITCTVTALEALNLREAPGTSSAVIAVLKHGDLLTILPQPAQGVWIPVRSGSLEGWIHSNYCERN